MEMTTANKKVPDEIVAKLRAPLPKEAVTPHPTKAYLSSIKVIYVVERLNEVFGLNGWHLTNEFVERTEVALVESEKNGKPFQKKVPAMVIVKSTLTVPEYGIRHEAYGGNDNEDLGDAYKGACTDALSKIGSYLFIGMDVYKGLKESSKSPAPQSTTPQTSVVKGKIEDAKATSKAYYLKVGETLIQALAEQVGSEITPGVEVEAEVGEERELRGKKVRPLVKFLTVVPVAEVA